jgi:hypothetical protein
VPYRSRFIESRLVAKMPAEPCAAPMRLECDGCGVPVLASGSCRSCREVRPAVSGWTSEIPVLARGVAMARAALRGLPVEGLKPALA